LQKPRRLYSGLIAGIVFVLMTASWIEAQPYSVLRRFSGSDGRNPFGSLTVAGSTIYGMATYGGGSDLGQVFKMNTDGSSFSTLHTFTGGTSDGANPYGSLLLNGSTFYGMTSAGGAGDVGVVFKMNMDGSGFSVIHTFAGGVGDGSDPEGSLMLQGSTLYGLTPRGGSSNGGVIFKVNTDGSGFGLLHEFIGGVNDGRRPFGSLTLAGSTLYGLCSRGGDSNGGVMFQINTDGSGFGLLHEFVGGGSDGYVPFGSLTLDGSSLYGMTVSGGDSNLGVVFQVNTDGTGFNLIHEFVGGGNDGSDPSGSLILDGSTLYGMTEAGGDDGIGVIFMMNTDGSGFSLLHELAGGQDDGANPSGDLTLAGSMLYGMTPLGGPLPSSLGTVFSYVLVPEPRTSVLLGIVCLLVGSRWHGFRSTAGTTPSSAICTCKARKACSSSRS